MSIMDCNWRCWECQIFVLIVSCSLVTTVVRAAPAQETATAVPYPVATPIPWVRRQPLSRYEQGLEDYEEAEDTRIYNFPTLKAPEFSPPQLLMTLMRTVVDILRDINKKRSQKKIQIAATKGSSNTTASQRISESSTTQKTEAFTRGLRKETFLNGTNKEAARGMEEHEVSYHDLTLSDHYHGHADPPAPPPVEMTATKEVPKEMMKQSRYADPWTGYYDFIITEGSFKFWSAFQLATAGLLLYSALAAIYYAKFNPIQPDYDTTYDDYFFGRALEGGAPLADGATPTPAPGWLAGLKGMGVKAYERILHAIETPGDYRENTN